MYSLQPTRQIKYTQFQLFTQKPSSRVCEATRRLHLAPPFLLEPNEFVPRYQTLSSAEAAKKKAAAHAHLRNCNLCPRLCGVNRYERVGVCLIGAETVKVSNIGPHFGEEPCIQGHHGSGAVFFSGCNLRCVFCQNYDIAHQRKGFDLTPQVLGEWYVKLQDVGGVHNINLVTPEHVVPQVVLSILHAAELGLKLPVVYNTSAFDSLESLQLLDGLIDIYMPDFKVWKKETSKRLLKAEDYAASAMKSIMAMHDQVGDLMFTPDGIAKRGLLVRHLIMPGKTDESEAIMQWFGSYVSQDVFVNLMEQYRPDAHVGKPRRSRGSSDKGPSLDGESSQASSLDHLRYHEINREVKSDEIAFVREAAKVAGLWRFCDPPQHSGFNL